MASSRESKIIKSKNGLDFSLYESFGWELLCLDNTRVVMSRDTQNPVYDQLVEFEKEFHKYEREYEKKLNLEPQYDKPSLLLKIILYILFIIPGILYTLHCNKRYEEYAKKHAAWKTELQRIKEKMLEVSVESRKLFFGKYK